MAFNPSGGSQYTLGASISSTQTTILLSSFLEPISSVPYTMALMNTDIAYGTIAPISAQSEFVSFTGITQNADGTATLTGVTRGLKRSYPFTEDTTFKLPHAGQSIFILSDAPGLFNEYAVLQNDNVFTGSNTVPTPVTPNNPATKAYVDAVAGGSATANAVIVTGIAGENITKDQLVYLKVSDGKWYLCDADTAATVDNVVLGLAQGAGTTSNNIAGGILTQGLATLTAYTVTAATKYYASNTAGAISSSVGTTTVTVGEVPSGSTTTIYFYPRFTTTLTENEKAALAAGSTFGSASSTNKFVTQDYLSSTGVIQSFGDGSDGDVTISVPTTLTRDMYYNNLVVTDTLTTDGYKIFVKGTISGVGTVKWGVPNVGSNAVTTTGGAGGAASGSGTLKNIAGAAGGNVNAGGAAGTASARSIGVAGVIGGAGIDNGQGGSAAGGAVGTRTAPLQKFGIFKWLTTSMLDLSAAPAIAYLTSSAGSGGGGGSNTVVGGSAGAGGGSGSTGGIVFIAANTWAGTFTINVAGAAGGNGANGSGASAAFGGGAGSGGSGGATVVIYKIKTWTGAYNIAGGAPGTAGTGNAFTGNTGTTGTSYEIQINTLL